LAIAFLGHLKETPVFCAIKIFENSGISLATYCVKYPLAIYRVNERKNITKVRFPDGGHTK
jgi:hypothetical protein